LCPLPAPCSPPRAHAMVKSKGVAATLVAPCKKCLSNVFGLLAPDPEMEVQDLLDELGVTPKQLQRMYRTFQDLRKYERVPSKKLSMREAMCDSMTRLVTNNRRWVAKILKCVLQLAGFHDIITWDGFVFVFLQFCTLSKVELAQVMFYIISREMKTWTVHFLTSTQLEEFYMDYADCPIVAFNTSTIEFGKLPLAKYRVFDFITLTYRFSQLINPCLYLQRELQRIFPGMAFWTDYNMKVQNRKITVDFFRHKKVLSLMEAVLISQGKRAETKDKIPLAKPEDVPVVALTPRAREGFAPLPLGPPRPAKQLRRAEEELPEWMQKLHASNEDPLRGLALGSAAEAAKVREVAPALPEEWVALRDPERPKRLYYWNKVTNEVSWIPPPVPKQTVEEAKEVVRATMGEPLSRVRPDSLSHGLVSKPLGRAREDREDEDNRTKDMAFVREARNSETKREKRGGLLGSALNAVQSLRFR